MHTLDRQHHERQCNLNELAPVDFLRTSSHAFDDQRGTPDEPLLLVGSPWRCSVNVLFLLTNFLQLGSLEIRLLQGEDLLQTADFDHRSERLENSVWNHGLYRYKQIHREEERLPSHSVDDSPQIEESVQ